MSPAEQVQATTPEDVKEWLRANPDVKLADPARDGPRCSTCLLATYFCSLWKVPAITVGVTQVWTASSEPLATLPKDLNSLVRWYDNLPGDACSPARKVLEAWDAPATAYSREAYPPRISL